jgi:ABC-type amino acid transport system permease subunit
MLPALGNDFISMMKDSSLLSVLAVEDLTIEEGYILEVHLDLQKLI